MSRLKLALFVAVAGTACSSAFAQQYTSTPNLFIPDSPGPTVQDIINVTGGPASIGAMAVTINITHTWDSDIDIVLTRGNPTAVGSQYLALSTNNGGSGDNYTGTRFIDGAPPITAGTAPFTGDFAAEGGAALQAATIVLGGTQLANFAGFSGLNSNTDWHLVIDDEVGADVGTLTSWTLDFGVVPPPPPPPPGPGEACATATPITFGSSTPFSTVGATDDGNANCGAAAAAPDVYFVVNTGSSTDGFEINTCDGTTAYDSVLSIEQPCGVELACNDDSCGLQSRIQLCGPLLANTDYAIRVSGFAGQSGSGTLVATRITGGGSTYTPPAVCTPDPESCGINNPDTVNGGCNSTPNVFQPITLCTSYCSSAANSTSFRDTDWHILDIPQAGTLTITGQAQFAAQWFLIDAVTQCSPITITAGPANNGSGCNPSPDLTISQTFAAAGQVIFFCSHVGFDGSAVCGTNADYHFTATFDTAPCGASCDPDFNCDGNSDQDDVACIINVVAGNPGCECQDPDFNGDGNVDQDDVAALINVVAGGDCP